MAGSETGILNAAHREIAIDLIDVPAGRRAIDPNWVETLADDFRIHGQRFAIEVIARGDRYQLLSGGHRLGAARCNGQKTILATVRQPNEFVGVAGIRLAEIAENFLRRELSALDRAFDVAAWREIFEAAQGEVKKGRPKNSLKSETISDDDALADAGERFAESFGPAAQKALGLSRADVFRHLKIARIGESIRQVIALLPIAGNQSELLALAAEPPARQAEIAGRLADGAASVADAIAIIDDVPPPVARAAWEKIGERFARLPAGEQSKFFALYEDAILEWVARRRA